MSTVASHPIDEEEIAWLEKYERATLDHFRPRFEANAARFQQFDRLLNRLSVALQLVREQGRQRFSGVDEAHNEICVADAILGDPSTAHSNLLYEPPLPNTKKSIDFAVEEEDGRLTLVDVKTIKPRPGDRWEQYERALQQRWFPKDLEFSLHKQWLGGELWHAAYASRGHFLQYTLELEEKLALAALGEKARRKILMFCGEGFHWHRDELEDFVSYYRSGAHRADDPFGNAEARYVADKGLVIQRTISSFACLDRRQWSVQAGPVHWNVQPPEALHGLNGAA